ncbi:MAG: hypothetical protein Q8R24_07795 [Legionellaceae bacterium]|nr:hypothetical protein [Legionellaceae bacterium]
MKKIAIALLIGSLLSSSMAMAICHYPTNLMVDMRNLGSENCDLVKGVVIEGSLYRSNFPATLPSTGEPYYFTLTGLNTEATLVYQCGSYKKFTVHMRQYWKKGHIHSSIEADMPYSVDVFEKHTKSETRHQEAPHNGKLSWQFYH